MQTKLPIITSHECTQRNHGINPDENHNICTFDTSGRRAACEGDEGGPLVYEDRLLGILLSTSQPTFEYPNIFFNMNSLDVHNVINIHMNALRAVH